MMDVRRSSWFRILLVAAIVAAGCTGDVAAPATVSSRVGIDVRSLMAAHAALGNGASIAASVELIASLGDSTVLTVTQSLAPTDSMALFDIKLEPGTYTLDASVFSNKQIRIFTASSVLQLERSGFQVELQMVPVTAVMVVSPRDTTVQFDPTGEVYAHNATVRNVGSRDLFWTASCSPQCGLSSSQGTVHPGGSGTATIFFPRTGTWQVTFDSTQGSVTVSVTVN